MMKISRCLALALALPLLGSAGGVPAHAADQGPSKSAAVKNVDGLYLDAKGNPTYKIAPDGTVDWHTFSGFRRFNGTCEVCHGPDGAGSSFGPDLTNSLKTMSYDDFTATVVAGRTNVSASQDLVMPTFGTNKNVMCYLNDIYVYLRARSDGVVGRGRPQHHEEKPPAAIKAENECMGP
ncbi:MAG: c-type cytochrome, methanol metabolism-related [Hyphomicrobium sp.]|nr:c-type cytochrome, methanol metabolism-related [Hyphomicrobium sp.]